jgi:hypothetical protein
VGTYEQFSDQAACNALAVGVLRLDKQAEVRDHDAVCKELGDAHEFAFVVRRESDHAWRRQRAGHILGGEGRPTFGGAKSGYPIGPRSGRTARFAASRGVSLP